VRVLVAAAAAAAAASTAVASDRRPNGVVAPSKSSGEMIPAAVGAESTSVAAQQQRAVKGTTPQVKHNNVVAASSLDKSAKSKSTTRSANDSRSSSSKAAATSVVKQRTVTTKTRVSSGVARLSATIGGDGGGSRLKARGERKSAEKTKDSNFHHSGGSGAGGSGARKTSAITKPKKSLPFSSPTRDKKSSLQNGSSRKSKFVSSSLDSSAATTQQPRYTSTKTKQGIKSKLKTTTSPSKDVPKITSASTAHLNHRSSLTAAATEKKSAAAEKSSFRRSRSPACASPSRIPVRNKTPSATANPSTTTMTGTGSRSRQSPDHHKRRSASATPQHSIKNSHKSLQPRPPNSRKPSKTIVDDTRRRRYRALHLHEVMAANGQ